SGFAALRVVLAHAAARQPVVLWVDDAQWADADSVALVESVFGSEEPPPVALVLSRRPASETPQPALLAALSMARSNGKSFDIDLAPLGAGSAVALAHAITGRAGAGGEAVLAIVEEA